MDKHIVGQEKNVTSDNLKKPSRWWLLLHHWGGGILTEFADMSGLLQWLASFIVSDPSSFHGAEAFALIAVGIFALGYFVSKSLVKAIENSLLSNREKFAVKSFLPVVYFLTAALLTFALAALVGAPSRLGRDGGNSKQEKEAIQALTEIQKEYSKLMETTDSKGFPKRVEKRIDTSPKARGEFGEIERFIKEFMDQLIVQRNDYFLELNAIGWETILEPNRINNDKTFVKSKVMLKKASEIAHKYRFQADVLLKKTRDKINSLDISVSTKKNMVEGFDRGMSKSKQQMETFWDLDEKVLSEVENIINLLAARKGDWIVQDGQIRFYSEDDVQRFNSYLTSIQRIMNEQQIIQKKNVETVSQNLDNISKDIE